MIEEKLIQTIARFYNIEYWYLHAIVEQCKAKGVLTLQEYMQLQNQGLPIGRIIGTVLNITFKEEADHLFETNKITYVDLMCMIGIIAQDAMLQRQTITRM